jgi:hypothetical protein
MRRPWDAHAQRSHCVAITAILLAGGASVSCGAAAPSVGVTPSPYTFTGTVTLRGEMQLTGQFSDALTLRRQSCEQYVRAVAPGTTLWVVPAPSNAAQVDGHTVTYTAGVPQAAPSTGYRGPGSYSGASALVSVLLIDNTSFLPGRLARTTITVSANGSGSMSFSGLVDQDTNAAESGRVSWICTD